MSDVSTAVGLVSVIVTSYNHGEYLAQRMDSILAQTYKSIEVIVIDDCSTDCSHDVLNHYENMPNVSIIRLKENTGYAFACNLGVELSRGDYVMFAECDDFNDPRHIEVLLTNMVADARVGVAYSRSYIVNEKGTIIGDDYSGRERIFKQHCSGNAMIPHAIMERFLMRSCVIPNMSAALIKKRHLREIGGLSSHYKACADWDMWCRMSQVCDFYYVAAPMNYFRTHENTVRNTSGVRLQLEEIFDILYRAMDRAQLTFRERLKCKVGVGGIWFGIIYHNPYLGAVHFPSCWRLSLRYDLYSLFYLLLGIGAVIGNKLLALRTEESLVTEGRR